MDMENPHRPTQDDYRRLYEKLSPHFSKDNFVGYSLPQGWVFLVEELHETLSAVDPDYLIAEVKQMSGGLRFYLDVDRSRPDNISDEEYESLMNERWAVYRRLNGFIWDYDRASLTICRMCGATPVSSYDGHGWADSLCSSCSDYSVESH